MDNTGEVSFKNFAGRLFKIWKLLLSKWLMIVIAGIIGGAIGLAYAFTAKPKYSANLNFVLSNNTSGSNGLIGLATQFGVDLSGNSDNVFSGDNIIVLMKSRKMVQQSLFKKPEASNQSLINIFIENYKLNELWNKEDRTKKAYPFPQDAANMTPVQDSLLRVAYNYIQEKMLDVYKPDKNESVYSVSTTSGNPVFSFYLTKYLVNTTSAFYISTKTSTALQNLTMLQNEADSLRRVLGGAITSAGAETDYTFNLNPAYQVQRSGAQQSQAKASALGQAYGQVLQNLEIAKITLQKETPLYQIIDEPTLPLEANKPSKLISFIIGSVLCGLIIIIIIVMRNFYSVYFRKT